MIDLLLECRNATGIPVVKPYVFGYGTKMKYLRARALLRTISENCRASNPKLLRGIQHDEKIQKQRYRLPTTAMQTGPLFKICLAMRKGETKKHGGKRLK